MFFTLSALNRIASKRFAHCALLYVIGGLLFSAAFPLQSFADRTCSNFSAISIPDNNATGVAGTLAVTPQTGAIQDLNIDLDITHTYVGDLIVSLKHVETGTTVILVDKMVKTPPSSGSCNANNLDITLDDQGTGGAVETICGSGSTVPTSPPAFTPNNPLALFNGESIGGTWELRVSDTVNIDTGTLNQFCMEWNPTDLAVTSSFSNFIGAVGSPSQILFQFTNNGPYDAEQINFTAQVPAQFAATEVVLSKGEYFVTGGGPFQIFIGTIPSLAVGETVTLQIEVVPSIISNLFAGPMFDSTVLFINSPASAPKEIPNYPIGFDASLHPASVTAAVVLANDAVATVPGALTSDACEPLSAADVAGKIVLIDSLFAPLPDYSGTPPPPPCSFSTGLANAITAGAVGVIFQNLTNNASPFAAPIPPPPPGQPIPAVFVAKEMGSLLRGGANATIQLGRAGVWETFGIGSISLGGLDPVESNNSSFFVAQIGKDLDDDGTADAIDACPSDAAKTLAGVCGCGKVDSTLDLNFNAVADCNEAPASILPPKPILKQVKTGVRITMPTLSGASYILNISVKAPGQKRAKKRVIRGTKNVVLLRNIAPKSVITAQYSLALTSPSVASSQNSEIVKLKTK
jgi:subtilisin-like proprotein convertase family protein